MKNLFLVLAMVLISSTCIKAQDTNEPIVLNVTYQLIHTNNLNDKENPLKKEMVLSLGKSSSMYISAETYKRIHTPPPVPMPGARVYVGRPVVMMDAAGPVINEQIYQYNASNIMKLVTHLGGKSYLIETKQPKINWKTANETREIGGFTCQKATGDFGGRTYTVWFAPELPFQSGPFKLSGLPGLILEATDSKQEVQFLFKDINKETDANEVVKIVGSLPVKITAAEYEKAKKAYITNPESYMQGQLSASAPKVEKAYEKQADKLASTTFVHNPIEL